VTSQQHPAPTGQPDPEICRAHRAGKYRCVRPAWHDGWHHEPLDDGTVRAWLFTAELPYREPGVVVATSPALDLSDRSLAATLDQWTAEQSGDQA
jgi:hypothetical protein